MTDTAQPFPGPRGFIPTDDRLAVIDLISRYSHIFDARAPEGLDDLFCADAIVDHNPAPAPGSAFPARGRDAIVKAITEVRDAQPAIRRRHMVNPPSLTFKDKDAIGSITWFVLVLTAPGAPSFIHVAGIYEDQIVRESDGLWRFKHRVIHRDQR
jgi:hypothetical protein